MVFVLCKATSHTAGHLFISAGCVVQDRLMRLHWNILIAWLGQILSWHIYLFINAAAHSLPSHINISFNSQMIEKNICYSMFQICTVWLYFFRPFEEFWNNLCFFTLSVYVLYHVWVRDVNMLILNVYRYYSVGAVRRPVLSVLFSTLLTEYSKTTSATLLALMDPENMKSILHAFQAGKFCYWVYCYIMVSIIDIYELWNKT